MPTNADPTAGIVGNSAGASDTANGEEITVKVSDMERMLNDMLNKALGPRLKRETKGLEASMEKILQAKLASLVQPQAEATVSHQQVSSDEPDKLNLKTLDARFKAMQDKIDAAERKAQEAEARATQTRVNSEVQSIFAKHAGQDNPHLPLYVEKYASQFRAHEGKVYRVAKDEFGEDSLVPLEQAASDMFAGELKHLIQSQPSRGGLPSTSVVRGMPISNTPGQRQGGIFEAEIMHHQAMSDPSLYASLYGPKK
jgi:hypothetical protein